MYARSVSDGSVAISKGAVSSCRGDSPIVPGIAGQRALPAFAELSNEPLLGRGLRLRPAYDGSASRHTELVPVVRYFGEHWFARSTQGVLEGGARVELAPGLHAGGQIAYEPGRKAGESDFLKRHGVPDVDPGASFGAHLEWDHKFGAVPITLLPRVRRQRRRQFHMQPQPPQRPRRRH